MLSLRHRFSLLIGTALVFSSCQPDGVVAPGGGGGGGGSANFITATINGTTITITQGQPGVTAMAGITFPVDASYYTTLATADPYRIMSIELGNLVGTSLEEPPTNAEFTSLFYTGPREFVSNPETEPGVSFSYITDALTAAYTTEVGDQTGSNFNITSIQSISGPGAAAYMKVSGTFNCKVYNIYDGTMLNVTNGSFTMTFSSL